MSLIYPIPIPIGSIFNKSKRFKLISTLGVGTLLYMFLIAFGSFDSFVPRPIFNCNGTDIFTMTNLLSLDQFDSCLAQFIKNKHLIPPPNYDGPNPNIPQADWLGFGGDVYELLEHKKNGTFLEVGIGLSSHTLFLEQQGWTGLLIDCNPFKVSKLKKINRKAWLSDVCLSTKPKPQIVNFTSVEEWPGSPQLWNPPAKEHRDLIKKAIKAEDKECPISHYYELPVFPLYSIIMATQNFSEIDYFSFDVQGAEIQILKSFPFKHFHFKVIVMAVDFYNATERDDLVVFLVEHGYKLWRRWSNDYGFVHKSLEDLIIKYNITKTKNAAQQFNLSCTSRFGTTNYIIYLLKYFILLVCNQFII